MMKIKFSIMLFKKAIKLFIVKTTEAGRIEIVRLFFPIYTQKHACIYLPKMEFWKNLADFARHHCVSQ